MSKTSLTMYNTITKSIKLRGYITLLALIFTISLQAQNITVKGVVVDAGHGGSDPGASGNGIIEKDLTLLISKYMYDRLRELGIPAYITRTTDETIDSTERTNRIKNAFGTSKDVIVISNHINAGGGDGVEVIYALRILLFQIKS